MTTALVMSWSGGRLARRWMTSRPSQTLAPWRLGLAALAAVPTPLYAVLFPIMRPLGELPFMLCVAGAIVAALALGRLVAPIAQLGLLVLSIVWLALSLGHLLPRAWTIFFETSAAFRQWSWVLLTPLFSTAFYALFLRFGGWIWRHTLLLAAIWYALSRLALWLSRETNWEWDFPNLYGVNNLNIPLFAFLFIYIFTRSRPVWIDLAVLMFVALFCPSMTNLMTVMAAAAIRVLPFYRLLPALAGIGLLTLLLIAPHFAPQIFHLDSNSGVRAVLWRDAGQAVIDTHGVGVGFGTEYIRDQFASIKRDWLLVEQRADDRLFISTHSGLYDVGLRMGLPGVALFLAWMGGYARVSQALGLARGRACAAIAIGVFCALAFNPGLTSVNISMGISLAVAAIAFLRSPEAEALASAAPARLNPRLAARARWRFVRGNERAPRQPRPLPARS